MIAVKKAPYSTAELADFLEPGMLGLQRQGDQPCNLLFKPTRRYDPRVDMLLEQNWFAIKETECLRAPATLEAYNELEETELEFALTSRAFEWVTGFETAPSLHSDLEKSPLLDYQKEAVRFLYATRHAMLSLSPGLGKTLTSAYAASLKGFHNVLAVVPASLLYTWKAELEKWWSYLPKIPYADIWHKRILELNLDEDFYVDGQFWAITNPETLARHLESLIVNYKWDCMIVDESIMYKHRDSARSKQLKEMAQAVEHVWLLTGAPATRYLDDMWHQFHILNPKGYSSYWRFAKKYCVVEEDQWGSKVVANKRHAEKDIQKNFADIYFSRTQDDVLDIPDWIFEDLDIPMHPEQDKIYKKLREELLIELEGVVDDADMLVTSHGELMIRSLQVASNPLLVGATDSGAKWDVLPDLMEFYPGPYIVWVNFISTGILLRDRFGKQGAKVALANGATKMEVRQQVVDEFQANKLDIIILNNQVGKFGFTLTKARTAFFVERMFDDSYFQCLHRNRRIGTTHSPIIVNMRSVTQQGKKTLDHVVHDVLDYRKGMIQKVTARMLREVSMTG